MSDVIVSKLVDYGLAGLVIVYLGMKIDKLTAIITTLCLALGKVPS